MRYLVLALVFAGFAVSAMAQSIQAGMYDADDRYVDLEPDVFFSDPSSNSPTAYYGIDLTGDGVMDLELGAGQSGSLAFQNTAVWITCSENTRIATVVPECADPCSNVIARSFPEGASIDRYCQWDTSATTSMESYWWFMGEVGCSCTYPGPYFGTRYVQWGDTLYGWVHIATGSSSATVFNFACELPENIGVAPIAPTAPMHYAYNAALNRLDIHFGTPLNTGCTLQVFDIQGRVVLRTPRSSVVDVMRIGLEDIPTGAYAFALVSDTGTRYQGKFVVQR